MTKKNFLLLQINIHIFFFKQSETLNYNWFYAFKNDVNINDLLFNLFFFDFGISFLSNCFLILYKTQYITSLQSILIHCFKQKLFFQKCNVCLQMYPSTPNNYSYFSYKTIKSYRNNDTVIR